MSLAAFTDSIVTTSSPLATVAPSSGSSTKTRSPSCSVGVLGDPDDHLVAVLLQPLVLLGVSQHRVSPSLHARL